MDEEDEEGHEKLQSTPYKALSQNSAIYEYSNKYIYSSFNCLRTTKHLVVEYD